MGAKHWIYKSFLTAAVIAFVPFLASAANVINTTIPVSASVFDPCTSELVDISGSIHEVVSITHDSAGGLHIHCHLNSHATGTGQTSGDSYVGNEEENYNINFNSSGTVTATEPFSLELVSQGGSPNLLINAIFHITINPDGTITSFVDTFSATCS